MEFNINHKVRVKLTDYGRSLLMLNHIEFWASVGKLPPYSYKPPAEDADGWSEWQLWELMKELGPHVGLGRHLPFETIVQLVSTETSAP